MSYSEDYIIFHDFERTPEATSLEHWPLHITIVPWFQLGGVDYEDVVEVVDKLAVNCNPPLIRAGAEVMYGTDYDIPATEVNDINSSVHKIHLALVEDLGEIGCRFLDWTWMLDNYSPHVSSISGKTFGKQEQELGHLTLASRQITDTSSHKIINRIVSLD
jgi:hypothetical protein